MEKERYKAFSYRLHQGTADLFKKVCGESGVSYNRLLFQLLKEYDEKKVMEEKETGVFEGNDYNAEEEERKVGV